MDYDTLATQFGGTVTSQNNTSGVAAPNVSPASSTANPKLDSLAAQFGGKPATSIDTSNLTPYEQRIKSDVGNQTQAIKTEFNGDPNNPQSKVGRFVSILGHVASIIGSPLTEIKATSAGTDPLSGQPTADATIGEVFSKAINAAGNAYADTYSAKFDKQLADMTPAEFQKLQNTYGNIADIGNIAGTAAGVLDAPSLLSKVTDAGTALRGGANDAANAITQKISDVYKNASIKDWSAPANSNTAGFKTPAGIFNSALDKGNNIAEGLVNSGIKLSDNVENGRYNTTDTAGSLRADAGQLSKDGLRPALQTADYYTPKTSVDEITKSAIDTINKNKSITAGDKETLIANAKAEGQALANKYPDGMSLTDMHDEKITYGSNVKRSPFGDPATNMKATLNESFRDTLKNKVEDKSPDGLPVKEFNKALSDKYKQADYLDSLHGKKVPTTIFKRIGKKLGQVAGLGIATHFGGGLLGDIAGYHLGGSVESFFSNMSNPVKSMFLDNLPKSNPAAFAKLSQFIKDTGQEAALRPQLEAGSPLGTAKNPIITPAPTTFEPAAQKIGQTTPEQPLALPPGTSKSTGPTIALPAEGETQTAKTFEPQATIAKRTTTNPKTGTLYTKDLKTGEMTISQTKAAKTIASKFDDGVISSSQLSDALKQILPEKDDIIIDHLSGQLDRLKDSGIPVSENLPDLIKQIPEKEPLYHGTTKSSANKIIKEGFNKSTGRLLKTYGEKFIKNQDGFVSLSEDEGRARKYATSKGSILSSEISPDANVVNYEQLPDDIKSSLSEIDDIYKQDTNNGTKDGTGKVNILQLQGRLNGILEQYAKQNGVDAIRFGDNNISDYLVHKGEVRVYNPKVIENVSKKNVVPIQDYLKDRVKEVPSKDGVSPEEQNLLDRMKKASMESTSKLKEETLAGNREYLRLDSQDKIDNLGDGLPKGTTPDSKITFYRVAKDPIKDGDQVTSSLANAKKYQTLRSGATIQKIEVSPTDLVRNEGLRNEFIYHPKEIPTTVKPDKYVDVEDVLPTESPARGRGNKSSKLVDSIKESIIKGEPIDPILVYVRKDGGFDVYDGHHRFEAMQELGIKKIPVIYDTGELDPKLIEAFKKANKKPNP